MGKDRRRTEPPASSESPSAPPTPIDPVAATTAAWTWTGQRSRGTFVVPRLFQSSRIILLLFWTTTLLGLSASGRAPAGQLQVTLLKTSWSVTASLSYSILLEEIVLLCTNYFMSWFPGRGFPLWAVVAAVAMRAKVGASLVLTAVVPILCKVLPSAISALFTAYLAVSSRPQIWSHAAGTLGGVGLCNGQDCWVTAGILYHRAVQGYNGHLEPLQIDHCQGQTCIMPRWPTRDHSAAGFVPMYHQFLQQPAVHITYRASSGSGSRDPENCTLIHNPKRGFIHLCTQFEGNSTLHTRHTVNMVTPEQQAEGWYHCEIWLRAITANYTVLTTEEYPVVLDAKESGVLQDVWKPYAEKEVSKMALTLTDIMFWQNDTKVSPERFRTDPYFADGYCHALALVSVFRDGADGKGLKTLTTVPSHLHLKAHVGAWIRIDSACSVLLLVLVSLVFACHLPALFLSYPIDLSVMQLAAIVDEIQHLLREGSVPSYAASVNQERRLLKNLNTRVHLKVENVEFLECTKDLHLTTNPNASATRHFGQYITAGKSMLGSMVTTSSLSPGSSKMELSVKSVKEFVAVVEPPQQSSEKQPS